MHLIQQGGQENGFGSNKAIWGREKTRFRWGRPLGGVQVGHGSLWTGGDKQAVTIVSHRSLLRVWLLVRRQGVFHIWSLHHGTPDIVCPFLFLLQGQLFPVDGWEIILGANMGMFGWEDEIWGHSCCLHPSKGALWAEEQVYCIGLSRVKSGSVVGVTDRQRVSPDLRSNFRSSIFWV